MSSVKNPPPLKYEDVNTQSSVDGAKPARAEQCGSGAEETAEEKTHVAK